MPVTYKKRTKVAPYTHILTAIDADDGYCKSGSSSRLSKEFLKCKINRAHVLFVYSRL